MIENSQQLGTFLSAEARRRGLMVAFDIHYDAENWAISWWRGGRLHRLDFQPMPAGGLNVTHYQDHIPWLPGPIARLLHAIGLFGELARTDWTAIEKGRFPIEEERVRTFLTECLAVQRAGDPVWRDAPGPRAR